MSTETTTESACIADDIDIYAITLRIAGKKGATNAHFLTDDITSAVAKLDDCHGIYIVQPVISEQVDLGNQNAELLDAHLSYALAESNLDADSVTTTVARDAHGLNVTTTAPSGDNASKTTTAFRSW